MNNRLEKIIGHATMSEGAILCEAYLISGVETIDSSFSVMKGRLSKLQLFECWGSMGVKLLWVSTVVTFVMSNPDP